MIAQADDNQPTSAGEHEAFNLMRLAVDNSNGEPLDYPRYVENVQNIPQCYTFMVGGDSPTKPVRDVRLRGYVLPDGTLEQVVVAHAKDISVLRRRKEEGDGDKSFFMDEELWITTALLLFGAKEPGK